MTQFLLKGGEFYQIIIRNKSELKWTNVVYMGFVMYYVSWRVY